MVKIPKIIILLLLPVFVYSQTYKIGYNAKEYYLTYEDNTNKVIGKHQATPEVDVLRDLVSPQIMYTHTAVRDSDDIGELHVNHDSLRSSLTPTITGAYSFTLTDSSSKFFIDTDQKIKISDTTDLQAAIYMLKIRTDVQDYYDEDTLWIHVKDSSDCVYIDLDAAGGGSGTRLDPYNTPQTSIAAGKYHCYKRGSAVSTGSPFGSTINFALRSGMMPYGSGERPRLVVTDTDGDNFGLYISSGDDACFVYGMEIDDRGETSRVIQGTFADSIYIINCKVDSSENCLWLDQDSASGGNKYCLIQNNEFNYAGEDAVHVEMVFSKFWNNISRYVSRTGDGGDGFHLTGLHRVDIAHNFCYIGDYYTEKTCMLFKSNGQDTSPEPAPYGYKLG